MSALRVAVAWCAIAVVVSACGGPAPGPAAPSLAASFPQRYTLRLGNGRILVDGELPRAERRLRTTTRLRSTLQ